MIKVGVKKPNEPVLFTELPEDDIRPYEHLVDGHVEAVKFGNGMVMLVNEEGRFTVGSTANFCWGAVTIFGTAVFIKETEDHFDAITESQADLLRAVLM